MATSKRDVELALRVSTTGAGDVSKLEQDVRALAAQGGTAGAEFERMADGLAAAAASTKEFRAAEAAAVADVKAAKQALNDQKDALDRIKASYQASGGDAVAYRKEVGTLRLALVDSKVALRQKQDGLTATAAAARAGAVAEKALADQVRATTAQQEVAGVKVSDGLKSIGAQLTQIRTVAAAALGGQLLGGLAGDISRTADEYSNLAARIKLTTGEGVVFTTAFNGVQEVAQRTNSTLEGTGTLFTKIAQAGKALGLGVADALHLTESINQAVQISGSSAEASSAAIIQLIQGLQSGVLRGDEFNSVMEQAPRLAKALADGLGVTTGELRKMAEAGKLTSATVISSLQGQSAVLQSEFEKLPATVGRALTSLSTSWTIYVGEVDKANGISAAAASAINALARNLDTLGAVLLGVGKAAAAYKAIGLAQLFLGHAAAMATATTATTANTAATAANTTAKQVNAVATAAAGESAAVGAGKFASAIASIKLFALVAVVTNLREIGTAIGEGLAKWAGYGKAIEQVDAAAKAEEETTRANAAAKAALAQQLQVATERALGLTVESKKLVDEFEGLRLKGEGTAEALEKLTKNLRLGDIKGIADAGAALDALGLKGELSADQIRDSFTTALKGIDLGVFVTEARAAFDGSEQGARRLAAAVDGALREAIQRSGLDFQLISGGMGKAAQSSLNDLDLIVSGLDRLQKSGVDTGRLLTAALGKAIDNADSQKAIETVRLQIESLRHVLGDKVADGFLDQAKVKALELKDALDKAVPGITSIREAYKQLGVQAPEDLARVATANKSAWDLIRQDGTAGADVLKAAFMRYAQSALDASGAAGTAGRETTKAMLEAEAAARGLAVEFDNTGRVIVRGAMDAASAVGKTGEAFRQTTADIERQAAALQTLYDKYRLVASAKTTADGFAKNPDGSAAGTFNNNLPVDQAFALVNSVKGGAKSDMTVEQARAALKQAKDAFENMQAFTRDSPGSSSMEYQQSTTALYQAARAAFDKVMSENGLAPKVGGLPTPQGTAAPAGTPKAAPAGGTRTVNINIGGHMTRVNVASQADSDALVAMLRNLESAKGTAA
jgi:tape measure domain-containing protein